MKDLLRRHAAFEMGSKYSCTHQYTALFRPFPLCLASTRNFFNSLLSSAIKIKPGFIQAYSSLGAVLGMQGKFKKINSYLQKGISIGTQNPHLHANIGYSFSEIRDWASAMEHY
ncbi:MAG: hypothetical protein P8Z77_00255, partial [Candidatus Thiodiazotropha sp.]